MPPKNTLKYVSWATDMPAAKINAQSVFNIFDFMMFFISYIFYRYFFNKVVVNSFLCGGDITKLSPVENRCGLLFRLPVF